MARVWLNELWPELIFKLRNRHKNMPGHPLHADHAAGRVPRALPLARILARRAPARPPRRDRLPVCASAPVPVPCPSSANPGCRRWAESNADARAVAYSKDHGQSMCPAGRLHRTLLLHRLLAVMPCASLWFRLRWPPSSRGTSERLPASATRYWSHSSAGLFLCAQRTLRTGRSDRMATSSHLLPPCALWHGCWSASCAPGRRTVPDQVPDAQVRRQCKSGLDSCLVSVAGRGRAL
jgi:hypothetical protein